MVEIRFGLQSPLECTVALSSFLGRKAFIQRGGEKKDGGSPNTVVSSSVYFLIIMEKCLIQRSVKVYFDPWFEGIQSIMEVKSRQLFTLNLHSAVHN